VRTTFIVGTTSYFNVVEELEGFQAVHKGTSIAYFNAYGSKVSRVSCSRCAYKHVYRRSVAYGALERAIQCFVELADRTVCSLPGRHAATGYPEWPLGRLGASTVRERHRIDRLSKPKTLDSSWESLEEGEDGFPARFHSKDPFEGSIRRNHSRSEQQRVDDIVSVADTGIENATVRIVVLTRDYGQLIGQLTKASRYVFQVRIHVDVALNHAFGKIVAGSHGHARSAVGLC
jgi:hypothetical protein